MSTTPSPQAEPAVAEPTPTPGVTPGLTADQEAAIAARHERREAQAGGGLHREERDRSGPELMRAAQRSATGRDELTEPEIADALAFFLASEADADEQVEPTELKLNLGTKDEKKYVRWVIAPIEDTRITAIRKESVKGTRAQRRSGQAETDEALVSRKIVIEGTVEPDPREMARAMGLVDPVDALDRYFRRYGKTGLITQISSEILSVSGWDDEDIQEVEAARG